MVKKLLFIVLFTLWFASGSLAQEVVFSDDFENGSASNWSGWIDGGSTICTPSIDTNSVLSGKYSYLIDVTEGGPDTYRIQRCTNLPLVKGYQYTISILAVADRDVTFNVLFEIAGDPYTKRLIEWPEVTTTPQTFSYSMSAIENVADNQIKLHFGGPDNDTVKFWIDDIVVTREPDPALVSDWGHTSRGLLWPIGNDTTTADGNAIIGNGSAKPTNWSTIRGGFGQLLEATTDQAVVVSGQLQLVGGGAAENAYTHIRYALTFQDSVVLEYQYTDSARWVSTKNHFGYEFTPRTGAGIMANGSNGVGTVWTVPNSAGWNSTYSGQFPLIAVKQAPRNAAMSAGLYKWAMSIQPLGDGTNEIRWYLVKTDNKYWYGGTVIDTAEVSTKFNGVCFGFNNDMEATQVNFTDVRAELGAPITVPEAPWEPFYVNQWGHTSRGLLWPIGNDSSTVDGDAVIGNGTAKPTNWSTIRGGFGDPVTATTSKAIIVKGQIQFVGGGAAENAYTHIRYALTYQDSVVLQYQYTDSARWASTKPHYGYEFTPRTGAGIMANGSNGVGTVWTVPGSAGWNSTYSGQFPLIAVKQAPRNAAMSAGLYDWAISVQPLGDGTNEVRWYLKKTDNKYWYGGTVIDTAEVSAKFNGVCFGFNNDLEATQVNLIAVQVDLGSPIVVPPAPWEAYYVTEWGFSGKNLGDWDLTPGEVDGNVTIGGTAAPTGWSAVRGGIEPYVLSTETDHALVITGKIQLVGGGFENVASLRYGVFNSDSAGTTWQDSTLDSNWVWTGTDRAHSGYLFVPPSGANIASWSGTPGTWGSVDDATWWDIDGGAALGAPLQIPAGATAGTGTYDFAISVTPDMVKATLTKEGGGYLYEAYPAAALTAVTDKINCVAFAINNSTTTTMNLIDVKVDRGPHIVTDVNTEEISQLPTAYSLSQNYPNPFNPTTTIKFGLPQASDVKLVIYDVIGRVVAKISEKQMNAGYHEFTFNASKFSSGIYFYRLEAGKFVDVKKMMLLK